MKLLKLTASQLKKIGVLEDQLTAISNASKKYDRAEWVKKKDELSRESHCTEDVNAAIEAADAFGMHVADAARAEAYRDSSGLMLNGLHKKIQQEVTCPLLQPILGNAAVAAGHFAEETEQKEKAEAEELGIPFSRSPKVNTILQRKKDLEDMTKDLSRQAPRRGVLKWLADLWITP